MHANNLNQTYKTGFSLVELSIVLVILGLLTGSILAGQSLIRAAELRAITTEYDHYQTAINIFKNKYFAIPGDMSNAEDFWGSMTNCGAASPSGTGTETCNGDGNAQIDGTLVASQTAERYAFWQHLSNAGLISGVYTGIAGADNGVDSEIEENVPGSKVSNTGWTASHKTTGGTSEYDVNYGNFLVFGKNSALFDTVGQALTPEETWNIDTKIDDGEPAKGTVIARYYSDLCASADDGGSAADDLEASYRLSDTSLKCAVFFRNVF